MEEKSFTEVTLESHRIMDHALEVIRKRKKFNKWVAVYLLIFNLFVFVVIIICAFKYGLGVGIGLGVLFFCFSSLGKGMDLKDIFLYFVSKK